MADRRISEFLDGGLVQTGDEIAAVRSGDNYKVRVGSAAAYDAGQAGGDLVILEEDSSGTVMLPPVSGEQLTGISVSDSTVAVSIDDTQAGYLEDKLLGSGAVTVTKETDSDGFEILRVDLAGGGGVVQIDGGGTGATTSSGARTNLGVPYSLLASPMIDIDTSLIATGQQTDVSPFTNFIDVPSLSCWDADKGAVIDFSANGAGTVWRKEYFDVSDDVAIPFTEGDGGGAALNGDVLDYGGNIQSLYFWAIAKEDGTSDFGVTISGVSNTGTSLTVGDLPTGFTRLRYIGRLIISGDGVRSSSFIPADPNTFEIRDARVPVTLPAVSVSGTSVDFDGELGPPSWARKIAVMFSSLSSDGTSVQMVQIGDSGGVETTGYLWSVSGNQVEANNTTGFTVAAGNAAASMRNGMYTLVRADVGNLWVATVTSGQSDAAIATYGGGSKELSGILDRIRVTTVNGTDEFDAGTITVRYEP